MTFSVQTFDIDMEKYEQQSRNFEIKLLLIRIIQYKLAIDVITTCESV